MQLDPRAVDFKLYLITDRKLFPDIEAMLLGISAALKGGVKAVQLREKDMDTRSLLAAAYGLRELTLKYSARLVINDRADIAVAVAADGVHLAGTSIPVEATRKVVGDNMLIGVSTHSLEEAVKAEKAGADFITTGPVYDTPSKRCYGSPLGPELIRAISARLTIPVFAIGGIKHDSVREVLAAGAEGIALISGILASEDIENSAINFTRSMA